MGCKSKAMKQVFTATGGMGFRGRLAQWWGTRHGLTQPRGSGHIYNQHGEHVGLGWRYVYDHYKQEIWADVWPVNER